MGTHSHLTRSRKAPQAFALSKAGSPEPGSEQRPRLACRLGQAWTSSLNLAASVSGADTALRPRSSGSQAGGRVEDAGGRNE